MKSITQIRYITKQDYDNYQLDFKEEALDFESYINFELGNLFDESCRVLSVDFISENTVVITYLKPLNYGKIS